MTNEMERKIHEFYSCLNSWVKSMSCEIVNKRVEDLIYAMKNVSDIIVEMKNAEDTESVFTLRDRVVDVILNLMLLLESVDKLDIHCLDAMINLMNEDIRNS